MIEADHCSDPLRRWWEQVGCTTFVWIELFPSTSRAGSVPQSAPLVCVASAARTLTRHGVEDCLVLNLSPRRADVDRLARSIRVSDRAAALTLCGLKN